MKISAFYHLKAEVATEKIFQTIAQRPLQWGSKALLAYPITSGSRSLSGEMEVSPGGGLPEIPVAF
jgi:hypothetical protein